MKTRARQVVVFAVASLALMTLTLPAGAETADIAALVAEVRAKVEAIRGVHAQHNVQVALVSTNELRKDFERRLDEDLPADELRLSQVRMRRMGLLSPEQDLRAVLLAFFVAETGGYYDPQSRTLRLSATVSQALLRETLAHEWAHVLQHERLDLARYVRPARGAGDYAAALLALLEGEALTVALALDAGGAAGLGSLSRRMVATYDEFRTQVQAAIRARGAPKALAEELVFMYADGLSAVLRTYQAGGWAAVEQRFTKDPPLSTEMILHPERAHGALRDCPRRLTLRRSALPVPPGWEMLGPETLGEVGYLAFFSAHPGVAAQAARAAAGWDGDLVAVFVPDRDDDRAVVLLASVWDGADEAEEAVTAARRIDLEGAQWARSGDTVLGWLAPTPPPTDWSERFAAALTGEEVCDPAVFERLRDAPKPVRRDAP